MRMTFIEYLLENRDKKRQQLAETYRRISIEDLRPGMRLSLDILKEALENRCFDNQSVVRLVNLSSRQVKNCRNEFGW
jgi:hypothetical protein